MPRYNMCVHALDEQFAFTSIIEAANVQDAIDKLAFWNDEDKPSEWPETDTAPALPRPRRHRPHHM